MNLLALHRTLIRRSRIMWLAAVLVLAQLGVASHPVHADAIQVDTVCAFCVGGVQLQMAPPLPSIAPQAFISETIVLDAHCAHGAAVTPTSRLTRGPPASSNPFWAGSPAAIYSVDC